MMARARRRHKPPATDTSVTSVTSVLNSVRCRRGLALFRERADRIWPVSAHGYRVPSQSGSGVYSVCLQPGAEHCTCPDYARHARHNRRQPASFFCKHLYAALLWSIKNHIPHSPTSTPGAPRVPEELERAS